MVLDKSQGSVSRSKPFSAKGSRSTIRSSTSNGTRQRSKTKNYFNKVSSSKSIRIGKNTQSQNQNHHTKTATTLRNIIKHQPTPIKQQVNRARNVRALMRERVLPASTITTSNSRLRKQKNTRFEFKRKNENSVDGRSFRIPKLGQRSSGNKRFVHSSFDRTRDQNRRRLLR